MIVKSAVIKSLAVASLAALSAVGHARADVLDVAALDQLNLIVFGDVSSSSEIEGRAVIGGNLSGNSNAYIRGTNAPASPYAALTVGGNQSGTVNVDDGGNVVVGGNAQTINLNGGGTGIVGGAVTGNNNSHIASYQTVPALPSFQASALGLSAGLDRLAANSTLTQPNQNGSVFTANPVNGVAVFDITGAQLAQGTPSFVLNGATSVIINVDATTLTLNNNFNDADLGADLLWNFYDAKSLTFGTEFGGTILAPLAGVTNDNAIDGTLVANSLTQNGEIHLDPYSETLPGGGSTPVPEPSTFALLAAGLLCLTGLRRRARR